MKKLLFTLLCVYSMLSMGYIQAQNNDLQERYDWLIAFADPNDCTTEKVEEYESFVGYKYLLITFVDGSQQLHNAEGTFYCKNASDYDCVAAYRLNGPIATWTCSDPQTAEDDLIRRLQNSGTNCYSIVSITKIEYEGNSYYLPNAGNTLRDLLSNGPSPCGVLESFPSLYDAQGRRICDFGFTSPPCPIARTAGTLVWTNEDATCAVEDPFSVGVIQRSSNEDRYILQGSDTCKYVKDIIQFDYNGFTFFRINEAAYNASCGSAVSSRFYSCTGDFVGGVGNAPTCQNAAVCQSLDLNSRNGEVIWSFEENQSTCEIQDPLSLPVLQAAINTPPRLKADGSICWYIKQIIQFEFEGKTIYRIVEDANPDQSCVVDWGTRFYTCEGELIGGTGIYPECDDAAVCIYDIPTLNGVANASGNIIWESEYVQGNNEQDKIFEDFPWLTDLIDPNNCSAGTIEIYGGNAQHPYNYLLVTNADGAKLYNTNGAVYCTQTNDNDCISVYVNAYGISGIPFRTWTCEQNNCFCPLNVNPVCGVDGNTYNNDCEAACAGVDIAFDGPCNIDPSDPCFVTISNTQCRRIGVYDTNDRLLATINSGPFGNAPLGTPTPTWTDPTPILGNEVRTYVFKEGDFILTRTTASCGNKEITTSNPYAAGCNDGLSLGTYTNTGCRAMTIVNTSSQVVSILAPGESETLTATNFIYIFLVGNDTIDIKSDIGGNIDSGGCGNNGNNCIITLTSRNCRRIGVYDENDNLLTTLDPGVVPAITVPLERWEDPTPLAEGATRTYVFKEGNFVLGRQTASCNNTNITINTNYPSGCSDAAGVATLNNVGCRNLEIFGTTSNLIEVVQPGASTNLGPTSKPIYILLAGSDTLGVTWVNGVSETDIDTKGCIDNASCNVRIINQNCIRIDVYDENDNLLNTMDPGPHPFGQLDLPASIWEDPRPLDRNATRTYIFKENNLIVGRQTATCNNTSITAITAINNYFSGCSDALYLSRLINSGCRDIQILNTSGTVTGSGAPGEEIILTDGRIYILMAGTDTLAIGARFPDGELDSGGCGNNNDAIFNDYPWLTDLVNPTNCSTEKVAVYQSGVYSYLLVTNAAGVATLYNQDGQFYCENSSNYDCVAAYNLGSPIESWTCDGTIISSDQCQITITNNECRTVGIYDEAGNLLTQMGGADGGPPRPNPRPKPQWTDTRSLAANETRTYIFKDGNLEIGRQTATCDTPNIDVESKYFGGCTDVFGQSLLTNIGCRELQVFDTRGNLLESATQGGSIFLQVFDKIYVLMAGMDTLAIGHSLGGDFDTQGCSDSSPCLIAITNNECRRVGVYDEEDNLLVTMVSAPIPNSPLNLTPQRWVDPRPLAIGEARVYTYKENNFILDQQIVTCENTEIAVVSSQFDGCTDVNFSREVRNTGCRIIQVFDTNGDVVTTASPGEVIQLDSRDINILRAGVNILAVNNDGTVDSGGCDNEGNNQIFEDFQWLSDLGNPTTCTIKEVEVWRTGIYTYLLVTDDNGSATLYNENGQFYCQNSANYNCLTAYNLTELVERWTCSSAPASECLVTITNNECRFFRIYDENDMLLTLNDGRPSSIRPNEVWKDTRPLVAGESRTYIFKDGILELGRQLVTCANPNIALVNKYDDGCTEINTEPAELTNVGCSLLRVFNSGGGLAGRAFPGETLLLENIGQFYILMVNKDTIGVEFNLGDRDIDTGGCPDRTNYNNIQIFETYSWLTDLIDFNNCSTERVEVWQARTTTYLWVVDANGNGTLYTENGQIQCRPAPTFPINCFQAYELRELLGVWVCGSMDNSSFECNTAGLLDFISCAPDLKEVAIYRYQGINYVVYFPKGNNAPEVYAHGCDSFDRICGGTGCNNIVTEGTLLQTIYTTEGCPEDNGNNSDEIFKDYPWLSTIVHPTNCSNEKVAVYQSGVYSYLLVTNDAGVATLYNQDGQFYCENASNYDCVVAYNLGAPIDTWECTGGNGDCAYAETIRLNPCDPRIIETALYEFDGNNYIVAFPDDYSSAVPLPTTIRNCTDGSIFCNQLFTGCEEFFERATKLEILASRADCSTCSIVSVTGESGEIVITDQRISLPVVPIEILVSYVNKNTRIQVAHSFSFFSSLSIPVELENGNNEFEVYITYEDGLTCSYDVTVTETLDNSTACNLFSNIPSGTDLCEACYQDISVYEFRGENYIVYRAQNPDCRELELQVVNCTTNIGFCVAGRNIGLDGNCSIFWSEAIFVESLWTDGDCVNSPEEDCAEGSIAFEGTVIENECGVYILTTDNQYLTTNYPLHGIGTSIPVGTTISFNFINTANGDDFCINREYGGVNRFGEISCLKIVNEPSNCQNTGTIFFENCDDGRLFYFVEMEDGRVVDPYFDESITFNPIDGQRIKFDFVDANFSSPCSIAEKAITITCVEEIAESNLDGSIPENFEDYDVIYRMCKGDTLRLPWLTRTLYHNCPINCPPPAICGPPGPEKQFERWSGSNLSFDRVNDKVLLYPTETTSYTANYPSFTCPSVNDPNGPAGPQGVPIVESTDILTYLVIVEEDANCVPSDQPEETIFNIMACPGDTIRTPTPARGLCPFGPFPDPSANVIRLLRSYGQNVQEMVVQGSGVVRLESYVGDWTVGIETVECSPRTYIYNITCPDTGTTEEGIFSEFSWLSDIVNPTICNGETINVYQLGSFKYVYLSSATGNSLYFQDGTFYCMDAPNYNCRSVYGLGEAVGTWSCANLLPESKERRSEQIVETSFFTISPNPTTDLFTIQLPEASDKDYQVQVIDMLGRMIHQTKLPARTTTATIDLADYQNGIYYVELRAAGIRSVKKLVKQGLE